MDQYLIKIGIWNRSGSVTLAWTLTTLSQKKINFPRYNMNCRWENVILSGIFYVVICFLLHFMLYSGNLDYFSDSVLSRITLMHNILSYKHSLKTLVPYIVQYEYCYHMSWVAVTELKRTVPTTWKVFLQIPFYCM